MENLAFLKRKEEIRTSKANKAHHDCIYLCQSTGIFATLASPIDTSVIRRMEKSQILVKSGFAHVYDKGYKKVRSPEMYKSDTPAYRIFLYARVLNLPISDRSPVTGPSIIEILIT